MTTAANRPAKTADKVVLLTLDESICLGPLSEEGGKSKLNPKHAQIDRAVFRCCPRLAVRAIRTSYDSVRGARGQLRASPRQRHLCGLGEIAIDVD